MKKSIIIGWVKHSHLLYMTYFRGGSLLIRVMKLFLKSNSKLMVFSSFGGRNYDDSPKVIYERIIQDSRFDDYILVWAFREPDNFDIPRGIKVKVDTYDYYKIILKARVWITNTEMTRALDFTGINTLKFNTWHGTAIKKIGRDATEGTKAFVGKGKLADILLAQSQYDVDVFSKAFNIPKECIVIAGLPRNDELVESYSLDQISRLKSDLGIPVGKKVILYAPTFRDYQAGKQYDVDKLPIDFNKWNNMLGGEFVMLFRAHPSLADNMNLGTNPFVIDVSSYGKLNELIVLSDLLVSDYSSLFFDYSTQAKPMLCFAYDYDEYSIHRGMYFDIREWLPSADNEDDLITIIKSGDITEQIAKTKVFQQKFVTAFGTAAKQSLDMIAKELGVYEQ